MADSPERIESEDWAYDYLRRAYPLYDPAELRHRIRHALKPLPGGGFAWKYSKGLSDMMREGRRDPIDLWPALGRISSNVERGRGSLGGLLVDPSVYEDMKTVLGNIERNVVFKALVRMTIKEDSIKRPALQATPVAPATH